MKDVIIIANGPFVTHELLEEAIVDKTIVALDGAANRLIATVIKPDIILGDFDSIQDEGREHWGIQACIHHLQDDSPAYKGKHGTTIVPMKNQQLTDLVKAIHYCDTQQTSSITIVCALGGLLDHHEDALRVLRSEHRAERPLVILSDLQTVRYVKDESITFTGNAGDFCAVLAFPHGRFSSSGLTYDVEDYLLDVGFSESIRNSLRGTEATISVSGEALIMLPPRYPAQRAYAAKTEIERLTWLLKDALKRGSR